AAKARLLPSSSGPRRGCPSITLETLRGADMPRPRLQLCMRRLAGRCLICGCPAAAALDAHRLRPGKEYRRANVVVLCANHHRLTHAGLIRFDQRKYTDTLGRAFLHYWMDGVEYWRSEHEAQPWRRMPAARW